MRGTVKGVTVEATPEEIDQLQRNQLQLIGDGYNCLCRAIEPPRNLVSEENFIESLHDHYSACFPHSSIMVVGVDYTISGSKGVHWQSVRYEQKLNIFGFTKRVMVFVIQRDYQVVFTRLGDGGFRNWMFSGWFHRADGSSTVTFNR